MTRSFHIKRSSATTLRRPASWCERVVPVRTAAVDGSKFDRDYCLDGVDGRGSSVAVPDPHRMEPFVRLMNRIGYDDRQIAEERYAKSPRNSRVYEAFDQLRRDDRFLARVRSAPSYDEPSAESRLRPANPTEFLYQMIAGENGEPALCSKVSPNATFVDEFRKTALLRSRCYVDLAYNTRDERLCQELPKAGSFPYINNNHDSIEACTSTVAIYKRPDFNSNLTWGPSAFRRVGDFATVLRQLGYSDAFIRSRLPGPTPDDYWEFVSRLRFDGDARARAEFVRRVLSLPPQ